MKDPNVSHYYCDCGNPWHVLSFSRDEDDYLYIQSCWKCHTNLLNRIQTAWSILRGEIVHNAEIILDKETRQQLIADLEKSDE